MDDKDVVYAVARGDRSAFALLYRRHVQRLFALAVQILGDHRESEDLVHDVFVEVWRRAGDYDPTRASVLGWLLVRVRSRAIDRIRSARARPLVLTSEFNDFVSREPYDVADQRTVNAALAQLPRDQQAVVQLAYYKGFSSQEIANRLGIPVGTVKSRVSAAIVRLRRSLSVGDAREAETSLAQRRKAR